MNGIVNYIENVLHVLILQSNLFVADQIIDKEKEYEFGTNLDIFS